MEMHQVRYFLALARTLNFTRAAQECNVTQPALTKAVQKLEHELGGELVHRERKLTQLTDLGKLVLPMLETALAAAESAAIQARHYRQQSIAPLRIGLGSGVFAGLVAQPLAEVARAIGGLEIELVDAPSETLADLLLSGEIGAAIAGDDGALAAERIDRWRLFSEKYVVLAAEDGAWDPALPVPLEALAEATWLCGGSAAEKALWGICLPANRLPMIAHRGANAQQLQALAAAGLGVMLAPEHSPVLKGVVAHRIAGNPVSRVVTLLAVAGRRYSAALDAFIKLCRTRDWPRHLVSAVAAAESAPARLPLVRGVPIAPPSDPALVEATHLLDN